MKFFLFALSLFILTNCANKSKETNLENGLIGYRKSRDINEEFIKNFEVKKIGFFKTKDGNIQYALLLNDNISSSDVQNFSLGAHAYKRNSHNKFLVWDVKPRLKLYGKHKYIIEEFKEPLENLDSISFFLYDRDKYRNVIGNRIVIKNLGL